MNLSVKHVLLLLVFLFSQKTYAQLLPQQDEEVSLYLGWSHQFQFAGYYAALEKGYFKEAGLDVKLIPSTGEDNVDPILSHKYEYGVATAGVLLSNSHYEELTVLAAVLQQSPVSLMALKSRGFNNL